MEHRALGALVVRMAGLFEVVVAMNAVPNAIGPFINPEYVRTAGIGWLFLNAFFSVGIPLLLGLFLIYFPGAATARVLRVEGLEPQTASESLFLERVAFSALGVWFAVDAGVSAVHALSRWHLYQAMIERQYPGASGPPIGPQEFAGLISTMAQLAFGLWLVLGNRGLANVLARLRG